MNNQKKTHAELLKQFIGQIDEQNVSTSEMLDNLQAIHGPEAAALAYMFASMTCSVGAMSVQIATSGNADMASTMMKGYEKSAAVVFSYATKDMPHDKCVALAKIMGRIVDRNLGCLVDAVKAGFDATE
jgi:hypothetical protein